MHSEKKTKKGGYRTEAGGTHFCFYNDENKDIFVDAVELYKSTRNASEIGKNLIDSTLFARFAFGCTACQNLKKVFFKECGIKLPASNEDLINMLLV